MYTQNNVFTYKKELNNGFVFFFLIIFVTQYFFVYYKEMIEMLNFEKK